MQVQKTHLNLFIKFAVKELALKTLPNIKFVGSSEDKKAAFGHSIGSDIRVRVTERHPIDIMRTLVHELIHYKQNVLKKRMGDEDQANALAGRIMRKFDLKYPHVFKDKAIRSNMMEDGGMTTSALPANRMGISSSTPGTGGIDMVDPLLKMKMPLKRKFTQPWDQQFKPNAAKYITNTPKKLKDIIGRDIKNDKRADKR